MDAAHDLGRSRVPRRDARRARLGGVLALLALLATGALACGPLVPLAALAAAGGGGGGSGGAKGATIAGAIITEGTVFGSSESLDREPNDRLGTAVALGALASGRARRLAGATGVQCALHALVATPGGNAVLGQELLGDGAGRCAAGATYRCIARRGSELFLVDRQDGRAELCVTPLESAFVKRRVALAVPVEPVGATVCLDALLVLDRSTGTDRIVAFDADDGRALCTRDLGRTGLAHLAGAQELATGRERIFTCEPASGELFELALATLGRERRLGALVPLGAPAALAGGIAALAYDGALLHVVDGAGVLHVLEPDGLAEVQTRPWLAPDESALALVAVLDLGLDGYHVEVPAGATLAVELAVAPDRDLAGDFFLAAFERSAAARPQTGAPLRFERAQGSTALRCTLAAPAHAPLGVDLVVGALAGSGRYELAVGGRTRAPRPEVATVSPAERALALELERGVLAQLAPERIAALYCDPLLSDFVPGRIVLGHGAAPSLAPTLAPPGFGLSRVVRSPSGFDVVAVEALPGSAALAELPRTLHGAVTLRAERREQARMLLLVLDGLRGAPDVAWAEPLFRVRALAAPNDPVYPLQRWNYDQLGLEAAWDVTTGVATTLLAVVDTGIRSDNPDLASLANGGNVGGDGFDFVSDDNSGDLDPGIDADPFDEGTYAVNGHHGSHVGGTMGARGNNGVLGTGVCWTCELMPVRALGVDGTGSATDVAEAIRYAAGLPNVSGLLPARRADVINLSLGTPSLSIVVHAAVQAAVAQGCLVFAPAGNDGNGVALEFPAANPETIAVAATDRNGDIADYSNTGAEIDITCPGGDARMQILNDVWSTVGEVGPNGKFLPLAGTSMACAHASGVAGLLVSRFGPLTQEEARAILTCTAIDIDDPVGSPFSGPGADAASGFGLVDAEAALFGGASPLVDLSDDDVDFGATGAHLVVQGRNAGCGQLVLSAPVLTSHVTPSGVAPTTAWLTAQVLGDGRTIQLTSVRSGLAPGDYRAFVEVTTNDRTLPTAFFLVSLTQGAGGTTDVGATHVDLFAEDGSLVARRVAVASSDYAWSFQGLAHGSYYLLCGVDVDGDGVLGELGEPRGAYPDATNPQLLDLGGVSGVLVDLLLE